MKVKDVVKVGNYVTTGMTNLTKVEYTNTKNKSLAQTNKQKRAVRYKGLCTLWVETWASSENGTEFHLSWVVIYIPGGGELPYVGYTGKCHRPGSIFHFQKSRTGPKFWGFTPEQAQPFDVLLQNRILFSQSGLRCLAQMSKSQLLSAFLSCSLMSSPLLYYTWASVSNFL